MITPNPVDDLTESYLGGFGSGGFGSSAPTMTLIDEGNDNGGGYGRPGSRGTGNTGMREVPLPAGYNVNPDDPANDVNAILMSLPPEKLAAAQRAMIRAGLLPETYRVTGFVDADTREAMAELLQLGNDRIGQAGTANVRERWDNLLDTMAVEGPTAAEDFRVDAARRRQEQAQQRNGILNQFRPVDRDYVKQNPLSLNSAAETAFRAALGRNPSEKQLAKFRQEFDAHDIGAQSAGFDFQDRVNSAERGTALGNFDASVAASASLDEEGMSESDVLWNRVNQMIADSPFADKIKPGSRSRSYAEQVLLYNNYKAGKGPLAAKPGTSKHGDGRANDLKYSSPEARKWVLANAQRYGLHFPIYDPKKPRHLDESWHVEVLGGKGAGAGHNHGGGAGAGLGVTSTTTGTRTQAASALEYAEEFAKRENPVEKAAYDIGGQFKSFLSILNGGSM